MQLNSSLQSLENNYMFKPDSEDDSCESDWILEGDTIVGGGYDDEDGEDTN